MKSKNVVQLHEVNTHTKESIKTTRSKCGGLFVRIILWAWLGGLVARLVWENKHVFAAFRVLIGVFLKVLFVFS